MDNKLITVTSPLVSNLDGFNELLKVIDECKEEVNSTNILGKTGK